MELARERGGRGAFIGDSSAKQSGGVVVPLPFPREEDPEGVTVQRIAPFISGEQAGLVQRIGCRQIWSQRLQSFWRRGARNKVLSGSSESLLGFQLGPPLIHFGQLGFRISFSCFLFFWVCFELFSITFFVVMRHAKWSASVGHLR
uniref:Uncharacterized protein n=1 Tax=Physcomitrium patens TaxID=3218 RepID=A0A2K1KIN2_PHYPA|nr:hypothetical protein PHYPA_007321 [Physcomitrium patens]